MADQQRDPSSQSTAHQQGQTNPGLHKIQSVPSGQGQTQAATHQPVEVQAVQDAANGYGGAAAGAAATAPFLDNFNLVAEAAKRAQMAVVMRDLEGVQL